MMAPNSGLENDIENHIASKKNDAKSNDSDVTNVTSVTKTDTEYYNDDIYLEERIDVPEPDGNWFSWRKLWLFTGPGWLSKNQMILCWLYTVYYII